MANETDKKLETKLQAIAEKLRRAKRVLFITGAGISADSGLPTYRGVGGLYNSGNTEEGYPIEQCLSASMFRVRPDITWKYMFQIGEAVMQCEPNPAHKIIAQWEKEFAQRGGKVIVFTQNIDGYHRLAGSKNVLDIHGSLGELFCTKCSWEASLNLTTPTPPKEGNYSPPSEGGHLAQQNGGVVTPEWLKEQVQDSVPSCPKCNAVIRPRIVLFEEMLPRQVLTQFEKEFDGGNGFDMVFSIGTSAMFPYITGPVQMAMRCGKITVEINPVPGELSHRVDYHLPMGAADALTRLYCIRASFVHF